MPAAHDMALDRNSVRRYDVDGRLHVERSNISKATVNEYYGSEIPDARALGLDPNRRYRLLRDPQELAAAAETFNNLPILSRHVPVSADDHQPDLVIGSTGTEAGFDGTYLCNSLVVWARDAIDAIESGEQKQLSSAYRYRADMTPGVFDGEAYDGVMRSIVGNHVALVVEGRAGPDVVVGDSNPFLETDMSKSVLSRKAAVAQGAIVAYLMPKLAQDAKVEFAAALKGVDGKNFAEKKAGIVAGVAKAVEGKLAQDAKIDDLAALLDKIEGIKVAEDAAPEKKPEGAADADKDDDDDEDDKDSKGAADAEKDDDKKAEDEDDEDDDKVSKGAMDAAIAAAVTAATKAATEQATKIQRDIRDAERAVRPYVGDLAMAHDSADAVYATALKTLGVKVDGVHPSAFPTILAMQPKAGETKKQAAPVAMDAAGAESFAKRFPDAARINAR